MYHNFLIHSSANGHLGCFQVLAIVNSAALNTGVHVSFSILVFSRYMLSIGIAGSYGNFIPSFLRNLYTILHSNCINCWWGCGVKGTFLHCWWEFKLNVILILVAMQCSSPPPTSITASWLCCLIHGSPPIYWHGNFSEWLRMSLPSMESFPLISW